MTPEIRIVIATAGRPDLLPRTLRSLADCVKPPGYRETIVVENGPRSGAEAVVANCPAPLRARYLHIDEGNKNLAINTALQDLDDDCLIFFTDDDVRFEPDFLKHYAQVAAEQGRGHFFGGPFDVDRDQAPLKWLNKYLPRSARGWNPAPDEIEQEHVLFLGFHWAAFVGDLRAAGWFDPMFGPGSAAGAPGDEKEMQLRLRKHGARACFVAGAKVWHFVPPERCTPDWTLNRDYRNAITKQLLAGGSRFILAMDLAYYAYKSFSRSIRALLMRKSTNPEKRFLQLRKLQRSRGHVSGCWYLLFQHRKQPNVVSATLNAASQESETKKAA
jgi:GT2 family glycosyltransferase